MHPVCMFLVIVSNSVWILNRDTISPRMIRISATASGIRRMRSVMEESDFLARSVPKHTASRYSAYVNVVYIPPAWFSTSDISVAEHKREILLLLLPPPSASDR